MPMRFLDDCKTRRERTVRFEDLKREYDELKQNIAEVRNLPISENLKELAIAEIVVLMADVKRRMHDYIDKL